MQQNETGWKTALEHVLESYPDEYRSYLQDKHIQEDEESAMRFLEMYESDLEEYDDEIFKRFLEEQEE